MINNLEEQRTFQKANNSLLINPVNVPCHIYKRHCPFSDSQFRFHMIENNQSIFCQAYTAYIWEGNGTPLQYSCLENPVDGGAWWAAVHGVAKSLTRLSDFTFTFHFHALEKETGTHSSVLAWRIPGMGEPGGLPSMGSHRVGHHWNKLAAAAAAPPKCNGGLVL